MSKPLLGADFLLANFLLVDVKGKHLVKAESYQSVSLHQAPVSAPHFEAISITTDQYNILLMDFQDIMLPKFAQSIMKHGVEHFI